MSEPVILTADDPEPPIGSVVLDQDGGAWQRLSLDWCLAGLDDTRGWNGLRKVGPLTLIHRGPEPEPPTTWKFSDPEPPEGTVIAMDLGTPLTFTATGWKGVYDSYRSDNPYTYQVLRWGWNK